MSLDIDGAGFDPSLGGVGGASDDFDVGGVDGDGSDSTRATGLASMFADGFDPFGSPSAFSNTSLGGGSGADGVKSLGAVGTMSQLPNTTPGVQYGNVPGGAPATPVDPEGVNQGDLGDCFFDASVTSLAQRDPNALANAVQLHPDGTYDATLYQKQADGSFEPVHFAGNTNDLPVGADGKPAYTSQSDPNDLRAAVAEKAYAQLNGGYDVLDQGGVATTAMEALTGKSATQLDLNPATQNDVYNQLSSAIQNGQMTTAGTDTPEDFQKRLNDLKASGQLSDWIDPGTFTLENHGLESGHEYTVMGVSTANDGSQYVTLRDPHGETYDPQGNADPSTHGMITMPMSYFSQLFSEVSIGGKTH